MPRGYDAAANRAWAAAKVLALEERRPLSLSDLWWGCWAAIDPERWQGLLPAKVQERLRALRGRRGEGKVKVEMAVSQWHQKVRRRCQEETTLGDMLLSLLEEPSLQPLREEWGVSREQVQTLVQNLQPSLPKVPLAARVPPSALKTLEPFTINLSEAAAKGRLTPAFEREREREALVRALLRKTKRNVALVGPAGVGKTKLVEDLALRLHRGEVPQLAHCTVLSLNLVGLRAGTEIHGSLEQRLENLRRVLKEHGEGIILFIDELHTIVGTAVGGDVQDVANVLKPLLAEGTFRCIGATTRQEYVQHIEADRALARRFQMLTLNEPSNETMRRILGQVKGEFESHHGVFYPPETLETILDLCDRFLPMRHYPDKALDLLDEAGAWVAMHRQGEGKAIVTPQAVREALAEKLALPLSELRPEEQEHLAERLGEVVLGQKEALERLEEALATTSSGILGHRHQPRGVFLFVGPPGVGKTLTARTLTQLWCRNERAFLELDLSQISRYYHLDSAGVDSLIGPRPPFVGWERGGVLTNHVLEFPRSIVLVRNIENASPDVPYLFASIFERGECEDGRGQRVSFRDVVFIFVHEWQEERAEKVTFLRPKKGQQATPPLEKWVKRSREEWLERLEDRGWPAQLSPYLQAIIPFLPLGWEVLREIAHRRVEQLRLELQERQGKQLEYTPRLLDALWAPGERTPSPEEVTWAIEQNIMLPINRLRWNEPEQWAQLKVISLDIEPAPGPLSPRPCLLVVDSGDTLFSTLGSLPTDWQGLHASGFPQARRLIEEYHPLLVLLNADEEGSLETLKQLRHAFPQQWVVLVTAGEVDFQTVREAFRQGAYDFLRTSEGERLNQLLSSCLPNVSLQARPLWGGAFPLSYNYNFRMEEGRVEILYRRREPHEPPHP